MPTPRLAEQTALRRDELRVAGLDLPVEVRRRAGARRLTLRVSHLRRAVVLTMPLRGRLDEAGRFVVRHLNWVQERLGAVPERVALLPGDVVPLRGIPHRIAGVGRLRGAPPVNVASAEDGQPELRVTGFPEHVPRRVLEFLQRQALADLTTSTRHHAARLGIAERVRRISVRDQSSRWGSCSTSGLVSYSWRLILAPPTVLDYVAAHEVAHLVEMNHGPRFWALVERTCPDLEAAKAWLRANGADLHRYGPEH